MNDYKKQLKAKNNFLKKKYHKDEPVFEPNNDDLISDEESEVDIDELNEKNAMINNYQK